jgi:hypothetical protein
MTYLRAIGAAYMFLLALGIVCLSVLLLAGCTRGIERMIP